MSSTIYVVDRKKQYQRDWNDEEHFRWEEAAIKTVERKNLEDAIRMSEKLRTLKYARPSSSGYHEAQEIITRMSKGVWEVRKIRVNDRYS
tara:strand:- start:55 stop:324 length:270 start_codon:yes stop_codon:yes gene_type:complete